MEDNSPYQDEESILSPYKEKKYLNILKINFYVLFILCFALSLYSWNTWKQTDSKTLLAIVISCILTKIGCILGLLGSFKTIQDIKFTKLNKIRHSDAWGYQILIVALYFLILVIILFIVFGTRALFYSDRSIAYLNAKYNSDMEEWVARYGQKTLEDMENWALSMTNVVGYTCYIIVFFILIIISLLMSIALKYEIINSVLSLVSLGILILSGAVVYILVYAVRFKQLMDFSIPIMMIISNVLLAFCLLLTSVYGYIVAVTDKLKYLKFYVVICVITACVALLSSKYSIGVSRSLVTQLGPNCFDFMSMVDQDYINTLGCGVKYLNVTDSSQLTCNKNQQRYIWEAKGNYGCLNPLCCKILITDSKAKFDYLAICSASSILILMVALWTSFYLYHKPQIKFFNTSQQHAKILIALVIFSAIWVYLISFKIPPVPATVPYKRASVRVNNAGLISSHLLTPNFCLNIENIEYPEKCEDCTKVDYTLKISGKGIIYNDPDSQSEEKVVYKSQDLEKIKETTSKIKLCPSGYNDHWDLSIEKIEYLKSGENKISTSLTQIEVPKNAEKIRIYGKVLKDGNRFEAFITLIGFGLVLETNSKYGEYSFDVPLLENNFPYLVNLTYSTGSSTILRSFQIGGIPLGSASIPITSIYAGSSVHIVKFVSLFIDQPEKEVVIELRKGFNNYQGPFITVSGSIELERGVYTILASSIGSKSDKREIFIDSNTLINLVFIPDKLVADESIIVFNWEGQSALDAKSSFILNEDVYCEVSYVNKICGGVKLTYSKNFESGGLSIFRIKPVGAYQYFFYAILEELKTVNAEVKIYVKEFLHPVLKIGLGTRFQENTEKKLQVWGGFCIDGAAGISSLYLVDSYSSLGGLGTLRQVCQEIYGPVTIYPADMEQTVQVVKKNKH